MAACFGDFVFWFEFVFVEVHWFELVDSNMFGHCDVVNLSTAWLVCEGREKEQHINKRECCVHFCCRSHDWELSEFFFAAQGVGKGEGYDRP